MTEKERKRLMDQGILKPLSEAFKDYPVEEEAHKGNPDYFITEKTYQDEYDVGDIVFVANFYYPNGRKGSNHLFVLIDKRYHCVDLEYDGMLLSSQIHKAHYQENQIIKKDNVNGLRNDSILKKDSIYQIDPNSILFKIGRLDEYVLHDVLLDWKKIRNVQ